MADPTQQTEQLDPAAEPSEILGIEEGQSISEILNNSRHGRAPGAEEDTPTEDSKKEETPEETPPADEDDEDTPPIPSEDSEEEPGEPKPRWKDLSAAEKSFRHLESKMHESTQEAASLRKEIAELRASKQPQSETTQEPDEMEKIAQETQAEIDKLDASADDYNAKVMRLLVTQSERVAEVNTKRQSAKASAQAKQIAAIEKRLQEEGLTEFADEFWSLGASVPPELKSIDEQIDWGIKKTKEIIAKAEKLTQKKIAESKKKEDFTLPAGKKDAKAGKTSTAEDEDLPQSLSDSIRNLRKYRTIQK